MHPILFEIPRIAFLTWTIGPIPIRLYGLMIGLGFLIGLVLAARQAHKEGVNPDRVMDLGVYLLLTAIVGSRILFVLTNPGLFAANPLDAFALWKGGLVFYGGLIAAVPVGIAYLKKHGIPVWKTTDIMAPSLALGQAFGRVGCFFAGCCYGAPYSGPACVTFHDVHSLAPLGIPLFPTQLMESGGDFAIFTMLVLLRRYKKFDGQLFWVYALSYAVLRFAVEFFRGDSVRGLYFGSTISQSQIIAVGMVFLAGVMVWRLSKKAVQPRRY
ncbi:MAG TPA: prolipoprotein diacylglyceryl transferase [Nitrospirota bacterium]|nr:prolipoprotein diacylglyceryl transferase [Nitrospirota bacterium]